MFDGLQHRWLPLLISLNPEVTLRSKRHQGPYFPCSQASGSAFTPPSVLVSSPVASAPSSGIRDEKELGLGILGTKQLSKPAWYSLS